MQPCGGARASGVEGRQVLWHAYRPKLHLEYMTVLPPGEGQKRIGCAALHYVVRCFSSLGMFVLQAGLPLPAGALPVPGEGHSGARCAAGNPCGRDATAVAHGAHCCGRPPCQWLLKPGLGAHTYLSPGKYVYDIIASGQLV